MFSKRTNKKLDYAFFTSSITLSFIFGLFGSILIGIFGVSYCIVFILKYGNIKEKKC